MPASWKASLLTAIYRSYSSLVYTDGDVSMSKEGWDGWMESKALRVFVAVRPAAHQTPLCVSLTYPRVGFLILNQSF